MFQRALPKACTIPFINRMQCRRLCKQKVVKVEVYVHNMAINNKLIKLAKLFRKEVVTNQEVANNSCHNCSGKIACKVVLIRRMDIVHGKDLAHGFDSFFGWFSTAVLKMQWNMRL